MKIFKKVMLLCLVVMAIGSLGSGSQLKAQPGRSVPFSVFFRELRPYGQWVPYGRYGRAWVPRVERNFRPYVTRGYWDYTEYGNTWVSDYEWGWAAFHYGRWAYDDSYGWLWLPDSEWAPAWVSWRYDDDYYGWAPLGPAVNININIPIDRWIFVPKRYVTSRRIYDYCLPARRMEYVYERSRTFDRNYDHSSNRYVYGPRREELERETRRPVEVHRYERDNRDARVTEREDSYKGGRSDIYGRTDSSQPGDRNSLDPSRSGGSNDSWRNGRPDRGGETSSGTSGDRSGGSDAVKSERDRASSSDYPGRSSRRGNGPGRSDSRSSRSEYGNSSPSNSSADPGRTAPSDGRERPSRSSGESNFQNGERSNQTPSDRSGESSRQQSTNGSRPSRSSRI